MPVPRLPARKLSRAFTLVELLVVLVIMGLILALVPPFLDHTLPENRVRGAARALAAELKMSRGEAIRGRVETALILDLEQGSYRTGERARDLNLPEDAALTLTTAESEMITEQSGAIRFFPDGSSTGGQIRLRYRRSDYVVDVNWLTGQVTLL